MKCRSLSCCCLAVQLAIPHLHVFCCHFIFLRAMTRATSRLFKHFILGFSQHSWWHQGFINLIRNPTCAAQQNRLCTLSERWKTSADFSPQFHHVEKLFLQRAVGVWEEDIFQAPYRQCRFSAPFSLSLFWFTFKPARLIIQSCLVSLLEG